MTDAEFERDLLALLPGLSATAGRMCGNRTDAEDLVAEAVAKAWSARRSVREQATFRGWMFRILTNTYIGSCRSSSSDRYWQSFADEGDEDFSLFERLHQPFLLWWSNPEQAFLDRVLQSDIERAIDALPEQYRIAVLLTDVQGFSYQEAAQTLDVPVGTIRSRLARGRALLQKALWTHAQDAGLATRGKETDSQ